MVDVYNTEAERRAAIEEVTRLRREFDTTTAKGAKAFAADPTAQAALAKLDAAKSAAGLRTSAQDLAALNRVDTGQKTSQEVTQSLNKRPQEYFSQVREAYSNPNQIPNWKPSQKVTPEQMQQAQQSGIDVSNARYDWTWFQDPKSKEGSWRVSLVGAKMLPPKTPYQSGQDAWDYGFRSYTSDSMTAGEWVNFMKENEGAVPKKSNRANPFIIDVDPEEIAEVFPDIKYSELQEIIYQLTLERDTDITVDDIIDKYEQLYGEG
jgi:hypothetical protein